MPQTSILEYVFVSYAHEDNEIAEKIVADLGNAGIEVWIDRTGLEPGTSSWDEAIRRELSRSFAVVLIASPNSRRSRFVSDELKVARRYKCPVYPTWVAGREWIDCVPLGRGDTEYIDCRRAHYDSGLDQLITTLKRTIAARSKRPFRMKIRDWLPQGYLSIELDKKNAVAIRPGSYESLGSLQDDLYTECLKDRGYISYTYGKDWILGSKYERYSPIGLLVVPWWWLFEREKHRPISSIDAAWANSSPASSRLVSGSYWRIINLPIPAFGIATNNPGIKKVLDDFKKSDALLNLLEKVVAQENGVFADNEASAKLVSPEVVNSDAYNYLFVATDPRIEQHTLTKYNGKAFIIERWWMFDVDPQQGETAWVKRH